MKKEFSIIRLNAQKFFLFLLVFGGLLPGLKVQAQNIDFDSACPNGIFALNEQEVGTMISNSGMWAIPTITAVNPPGGGDITMSLTRIDVLSGGFTTGEGCDPCVSPVTIHGITFTTSGANFTITGTPDNSSAGYSFEITLQASVGGTNCSRTYTFNIVSKGTHQGDPHMTTVDGVRYDFQSAGEFILLQGDKDDNFEIQTRQTAVATNGPGTDPHTGLTTCVSLNTAVAARVGNHRITYEPNINGKPDSSGMQLRVDGDLTTLDENGLDLGSGGRIMKSAVGEGIEIDFPNGTSMVVTSNWWSHYGVWYLNIDVYRTRATKGIMGVIAPRSWLPKLPDGKSVGPMLENLHERFIQLYKTFADAWRVTDDSSLFDYAPGTSTATFTNMDWPLENAQSCGVPNQTPKTSIEFEVAEQLCRDIVDPGMKANAIFDVMVTGEPLFANAYLVSQQIQTGATAIRVNADKDTTMQNESVNFTATVMRKFSAENSPLAGTVEFIIDGKKFQQVKLEANGLAVLSVTSLEPGQHEISAKFIPDSGGTTYSSISSNITHTVLGGDAGSIWFTWWFWLIVAALILIIILLLSRKKKSP